MARGKGEGSIYKDSRGLWTAAIELPQRNGDRRRKVIRSKDKAALVRKLRELQKERDDKGDLETHVLTVEQWLTIWFQTIAQEKIRPRTAKTYQSLIEKWILPSVGTKQTRQAHPRRRTANEPRDRHRREVLDHSTASPPHPRRGAEIR
jgi:DNA primase